MCGVADSKIGQLRKDANSKQISYMTLIGVYSAIHLMHPNYGHVTTIYIHTVDFLYMCSSPEQLIQHHPLLLSSLSHSDSYETKFPV